MTDPAQSPTPPPGWTPPATPPFGAPVGPPAGAPAPASGRPAPSPAPQYGPPPGSPYAQPGARYTPPGYAGAPAPRPAEPRRSPVMGIVALVAAVAAMVGASIAGGIAAFSVGLGTGGQMSAQPLAGDFDWSILSPVRDAVLAGEVSFWIGTALGLWALVQGTIAIVRGSGRGFGVAAVLVAALGPIAFFTAVQIGISTGLATGAGFTG